MPDVLEATVVREVDGGVLAVVVKAFESADVTDSGVRHDDSGEPSRRVEDCGRGPVAGHDSSLYLIRLSMLDYKAVNIDYINASSVRPDGYGVLHA
ncbi:hypothetical protein GCM10023336_07110 [Streptomyces similanensis]|uniref:Uncharacterized protein n=1 Tax=Streptomyces similanensis TaxID=1274988 RepID=A0ABP9JWR9_9ACTN